MPKYDLEDFLGNLWHSSDDQKSGDSRPALSRLSIRKRRRQQVMALIVAANPTAVADRVIREMKRGATALHGRGMFLKQERDVLLVALTVTEIEQLKVIVRQEDPHAFITVIPTNESRRRGVCAAGRRRLTAEELTPDARRRDAKDNVSS